MDHEVHLIELVKRHYPKVMNSESTFLVKDLCKELGVSIRELAAECLYKKIIKIQREQNADNKE